jgi:hypothetical protein
VVKQQEQEQEWELEFERELELEFERELELEQELEREQELEQEQVRELELEREFEQEDIKMNQAILRTGWLNSRSRIHMPTLRALERLGFLVIYSYPCALAFFANDAGVAPLGSIVIELD